MAEPILGEALALQSNFQPDTTPLLTRSLMRAEEMDLKKAIRAQKQQEAEQKRLAQIAGSLKIDYGKIHPHYIKSAQKLVAGGINAIQNLDPRDYANKLRIQSDMEAGLQNLRNQSDQLSVFEKGDMQGFLVPQDLKMMFRGDYEEVQPKLRQFLEEKPQYKLLFNVDEQGNYIFSGLKDVNVDQELIKDAKSLEYRYEPTKDYRIDPTTKDKYVKYKLPDKIINELATTRSQDPEYVANILVKNNKEVSKEFARLAPLNPNMPLEQVQQLAVRDFLIKKYKDVAQTEKRTDIPQGRGGLSIGFGAGAAPLSYDFEGNPTNSTIDIKVQGEVGGAKAEYKRQVPTGNSYTFKPTKIIGTKAYDVIDMETNKPVQAKILQEVETGEVVAVPIATRDFKTSSGVTYRKGEMVDSKALNIAKEKGFVSYQPMVKGIASFEAVTDTKGTTTTVRKNVLMPASRVKTGILTGLSGQDVQVVDELFMKAQREANELNSRQKRRSNTRISENKNVSSQPQQGKRKLPQ